MAKLDEESLQSNTHRSPASTLPPDVLSLIFQYACRTPDLNEIYGLSIPVSSDWRPSSPEKKRIQFILSAVSVHWRQVSTLLTPYIWTFVDLIIRPSTVNAASAILQAFLTYSGRLPLAIALEFAQPWKYDTKVLVDASCDAALYENTHRIRELYLFGLPDSWIDIIPSLSNLDHLSVQDSFVQGVREVVIKSQCSNLTLTSFSGGEWVHCSQLTVLRLQGGLVDSCLQMLMTCPNLIEFRSRVPEAESGDIALPTKSFVLLYMEVFEWSVYTTSSTDEAMLRHVRLPALRKLVWVEEDCGTFHTLDPRNIFFCNLPSTLVDLHIHGARILPEEADLASVFDYACNLLNIEQLTFSGVDRPFLDRALNKLAPTLDTMKSGQKVALPKLRALNIKGPLTASELNQDKVLEMIQCRFLAAGILNWESFRLELPSAVAWLPLFKEKVERTIERGLQVEMFERPGVVSWLLAHERS